MLNPDLPRLRRRLPRPRRRLPRRLLARGDRFDSLVTRRSTHLGRPPRRHRRASEIGRARRGRPRHGPRHGSRYRLRGGTCANPGANPASNPWLPANAPACLLPRLMPRAAVHIVPLAPRIAIVVSHPGLAQQQQAGPRLAKHHRCRKHQHRQHHQQRCRPPKQVRRHPTQRMTNAATRERAFAIAAGQRLQRAARTKHDRGTEPHTQRAAAKRRTKKRTLARKHAQRQSPHERRDPQGRQSEPAQTHVRHSR